MKKRIYSLFFLTVLCMLFFFTCISCAKTKDKKAEISIDQSSTTFEAKASNQEQQKDANTAPSQKGYYVSQDDIISTPDSTAFSQIGYNVKDEILLVTFRNSGKTYLYLDFPSSEWGLFKKADSLGGYYNKYIKGNYTCIKP